MIATEPQSEPSGTRLDSPRYETFADDRHLIIYGQRTSDGRIAFGGRGAPYHFGSTVEPRFDESPKVFALLEATLRELFPSLEGEIAFRWGGPLAMARDQSPSVVVDHVSGLASAGGYTGDGVVMSYVAANALADLIVDPDAQTDVHPTPLRPAPKQALGDRAAPLARDQRGAQRRKLGRPSRSPTRSREPRGAVGRAFPRLTYRRMLTASPATMAIVMNEMIDSRPKSAFICVVSGMASAGAKLVPLASDV